MSKKEEEIKKSWPTKDAMVQIYEKNLWGGNKSEFYSGLGSHHPETVNPYLAVVADFLKSFDTPPLVCDLGCGDFNVGKKKYSTQIIWNSGPWISQVGCIGFLESFASTSGNF